METSDKTSWNRYIDTVYVVLRKVVNIDLWHYETISQITGISLNPFKLEPV